jgi:hypothetical protein
LEATNCEQNAFLYLEMPRCPSELPAETNPMVTMSHPDFREVRFRQDLVTYGSETNEVAAGLEFKVLNLDFKTQLRRTHVRPPVLQACGTD